MSAVAGADAKAQKADKAPLRFYVLEVLYNDGAEDKENGYIELFGITESGRSIKVEVDFGLYFYLELPDHFQTKMLPDLNAFLDQQVWCASKFIASRKVVKLEPARPFQFHKKLTLLKLTFRKQKHFQMTRSAMSKINKLAICGRSYPFNMFETDMRPVERFNSIHLNPVGFVQCFNSKILPGASAANNNRITSTQLYCKCASTDNLVLDKDADSLPPNVVAAVYDIESRTLDPNDANAEVLMISCIIYGRHRSSDTETDTNTNNESIESWLFTWKPVGALAGVCVVQCENERDCIAQFRNTLFRYDVDVLVGHNSSGFDANYLYVRAEILALDEYKFMGKNGQASEKARSFSQRAASFINAPGRVQVDTMEFLRLYGKKQDDYALKTCASIYLSTLQVPSKTTTVIDPSAAKMSASKPIANPVITASTPFHRELVKVFAEDGDMLTTLKGDVPWQLIAPYFDGDDLAKRTELGKYCVKDSVLTLRLYVETLMFIRLFTMAQIFRVTMQTMLTSGLQDKVISNMFTQMHSQGILYNKYSNVKNDPYRFDMFEYEGGLVHQPKKGKYNDPVCVLDFSGMYPSIMMHHNICMNSVVDKSVLTPAQYEQLKSQYKHLEIKVEQLTAIVIQEADTGFLPAIQKRFAMLRKRYKTLMKNETVDSKKSIWNCSQLAVKLAQNAMYGFFAVSIGARFSYPLVAATITQIGRNMNQASVQMTHTLMPGAQLLYGDTDSIMIKDDYSECKTDAEKLEKAFRCGAMLAEKITQSQESEFIEIALEKIYFPFCLYDRKKFYTGRKWTLVNGKICKDAKVDIVGGEVKRRDTCPDLRELLGKLGEMLLSAECTTPQIVAFVKEHLNKVVTGQIPFQKFIRVVELARDPESYEEKPAHVVVALKNKERGRGECQKGSRIAFVHVLTGTNESNGKKKVRDITEDAAYALEQKMRLDYEFYLHHHYNNAIVSLLCVLDADLSTLLDDAMGYLHRKHATGGRTLKQIFADQKELLPTAITSPNAASSRSSAQPPSSVFPCRKREGHNTPSNPAPSAPCAVQKRLLFKPLTTIRTQKAQLSTAPATLLPATSTLPAQKRRNNGGRQTQLPNTASFPFKRFKVT